MPYTDKEKAKAQQKAWHSANKERINATKKVRYAANPNQYSARKEAYREAHTEQIKAYQKAYREAHKEQNKEQKKTRAKAYYKANLERIKEKKNAYRKRNKDKTRNDQLLRDFGIPLTSYNGMLDLQGHACAICHDVLEDATGRGKTLHVDHCHETGQVRELLCSTCNTSLGGFKDREDLLAAAIVYLQKHKRLAILQDTAHHPRFEGMSEEQRKDWIDARVCVSDTATSK
jgi:hypothetical protein